MKMVLRTDLMVTRRVATPALPRRLRLSAEERRDQAKALSFFRGLDSEDGVWKGDWADLGMVLAQPGAGPCRFCEC